ncbi:hypothetical protein OAH94_02680 [Amylibacter sp.]|nr:hypothetical protein [Amylibacter sp.]
MSANTRGDGFLISCRGKLPTSLMKYPTPRFFFRRVSSSISVSLSIVRKYSSNISDIDCVDLGILRLGLIKKIAGGFLGVDIFNN